MYNLLQQLGHLDRNGIVTMKGRIACEFTIGDNLVLTELLFKGEFKDTSEEELCALLSCFIEIEKSEHIVSKPPQQFHDLLGYVRKCANKIGLMQAKAGVPVDIEKFVDKF